MTELLTQLWTPELQMALSVVVVCLVILYVLSIIWVARDGGGTSGRSSLLSRCWASLPIACSVRLCCRSTATSKSSRLLSSNASS